MKTKEYLIKNFIPIAKEEAKGLSDVIECLESIEHYLNIQMDAVVKHDFCDTFIVHLIERQLQGHSGNIWETIEAFENEDMAVDKKRMLNRRDTAYAHRVTSIKLTDKLSKNSL